MRLLLLLFPILFLGCLFEKGNTNDRTGNSYVIDSIVINQTKKLLPEDTVSPKQEIKLNIKYPAIKGEKNLSFIINALNHHLFNDSVSGKSIEVAAKDFIKTQEAEYISLKKDYSELLKEGIPASFNYDAMISGDISYADKHLFSYQTHSYFYTGGAHGISPVSFFTIDLKEKKVITLHSLFRDEVLGSITDLIKEQLVVTFDCKSEDELSDLLFNVDELAPNENFMITEEGIRWVYNQYEIAPYSFGNIEIVIPFEEIKPFLKENSPISHIVGE